jgi:molybdenum cofactor biosynthesis protein B
MSPINENKNFIIINIAILTISDSRTLNNDKSGDLLLKKINEIGHKIFERKIVKDEISLIKKNILSWSSNNIVDVIITTGGTGLTERDSTPEAILQISDKIIDGFGELFRQISYNKIGTSTIQSRALGAVVNGTYIFALPGSTSACKDAWDEILKYQLDNRYQPCNFIEIIPKLRNFK